MPAIKEGHDLIRELPHGTLFFGCWPLPADRVARPTAITEAYLDDRKGWLLGQRYRIAMIMPFCYRLASPVYPEGGTPTQIRTHQPMHPIVVPEPQVAALRMVLLHTDDQHAREYAERVWLKLSADLTI